MATPVISPIVSIQSYAKSEYFDFQPTATNSPTSWTATLPAGLSINADTGLVSGAIAEQGIYDLNITAHNADGASDPLIFPLRIRPSNVVSGCSVDIDVDVETGAVSRASGGSSKDPIITAKHGDQVLVAVGFKKQGVLLGEPGMTLVRVGLKEFEPDALLDLTTGLTRIIGTYDTKRYLIELDLDKPEILSALANYEDDRVTFKDAVAEIEFTFFETVLDGQPPKQQVRSSENFTLRLGRDVVANI